MALATGAAAAFLPTQAAPPVNCPIDHSVIINDAESVPTGTTCQITDSGSAMVSDTGSVTDNGTLSNAGSLTTQSGGTVTNNFDLVNQSGGTITNSGALTNDAGNSVGGSATGLQNYGSVMNQAGGTIDNTANGFMGNYGDFSNAATVTNEGSLYNNSGQFYGSQGTITNVNDGHLTNSGYFGNGGILNNKSGATFKNTANMSNYGTINNTGSFINDAGLGGDYEGLLNDGQINNNGGTVNVTSNGDVYGGGNFKQTGGTTIVNGSLRADTVDVEGGVLAGNGGTVGSPNAVTVADGAAIEPGGMGQVGVLNVDGSLALSGTFDVDVFDTDSFDFLNTSGDATFSDSSMIAFLLGNDSSQAAGQTFDFFLASSIMGFDNIGFTINGLMNGLSYSVSEISLDGNDGLQLKLTGAAPPPSVPEPAALGMMGLGLVTIGGFASLRRRHNKGSARDRLN